MKKILFASLMLVMIFCLFSFTPASAQKVYVDHQKADTTINQDTTFATVTVYQGTAKTIQATVKKVSGTVAGYVVLQATIDGQWVSAASDSLTLSNQDFNSKVWSVSNDYLSYRAMFISPSGTQSSVLSISLLRQAD